MAKPCEESYKKIIDTAKFPAFLRTFSDIPNALEVYSFLKENSPSDSQVSSGLIYEDFLWLAPIAEARQKAISNHLNNAHYDAVIELGAGFSTRWCQLKGRAKFYDTDLKSTVELKKNMVEQKSISLLNLTSIDVLNPFETSLSDFVKQNVGPATSIAIVHEGLAQYFDRTELAALAYNIYELSRTCHVEWISTDFSTVAQFEAHNVFDPNMKTLTAARHAASGRDLMKNAFSSTREIEKYFELLKFKSGHSLIFENPDSILSFKKVSVDRDRFLRIFYEHLRVWRLVPNS